MKSQAIDVEALFKKLKIDAGYILEKSDFSFSEEQVQAIKHVASNIIIFIENKDLINAQIIVILCNLISAFPMPE